MLSQTLSIVKPNQLKMTSIAQLNSEAASKQIPVTSVKQNKVNPRATTSIRRHIDQYLQNATLHGLRYIGDRTLSWFERIFFVCVLVLVLCFSVFLIRTIWTQWMTETIVTSSSYRKKITHLPFPAVTICNTNLVRKSVAQKIAKDSLEFSILNDVCNIETKTPSSTTSWENMQQVVKNISHQCDEMIIRCVYGKLRYNCSDIFHSVLTDSGVCCRFNAIPSHMLYGKRSASDSIDMNIWDPESGFNSDEVYTNPYIFPRPFVDVGSGYGLKITLNAETHERYCAVEPGAGFKVLVHEPQDDPHMNEFSLVIPYAHTTRIMVTPFLLEANKDIRRIAVKDRSCLFQDENPLEFYRIYSEQNCLAECKFVQLHNSCNCSYFNLRSPFVNSTICTSADIFCLVDGIKNYLENLKKGCACECLPACSELKFNSVMSTTRLLRCSLLTKETGLSVNDLAVLNVFFTERSIRGFNRNQRVTFTDFLSNIGGLLGLFLGFSMISIAELLYFSCIRPLCIYGQLLVQRKPLLAEVRGPKVPE